jgi:hypothetical protein
VFFFFLFLFNFTFAGVFFTFKFRSFCPGCLDPTRPAKTGPGSPGRPHLPTSRIAGGHNR